MFIHTLPYELMWRIFSEIIISQSSRQLNMEYCPLFAMPRSNVTTLLRVSQVCGRWRAITLSHGLLWASAINVDRDSAIWIQKLMQCAKDVPVVIQSGPNEKHSSTPIQNFQSNTWRSAFANMENWGAFSLQACFKPDQGQLVASALTRPALKLKSFVLLNTHQSRIVKYEEIPEPLVLPGNLFGGHAPHLQHFATSNVCFLPSFNFSIWKHLTALSIDQPRDRGGLQSLKLSAQQWLEVLRGLTQLEYLDLVWNQRHNLAVLDSGPNIADITDDVHLDRLRLLHLKASFECNIMLDVFVKLVVPDLCSTTVRIMKLTLSDVDFKKLEEGLQRRVSRWFKCVNNYVGVNPFHVALRDIPTKPLEIYGFRIDVRNFEPRPFPGEELKYSNFEFKYCGHLNFYEGGATAVPVVRILDILQRLHIGFEYTHLM